MPKIHSELSIAQSAYLTDIFRLIEQDELVTTGLLASRFGVKPATVVGVINELIAKEMLRRVGWGRVELTEKGRAYATELIHNHRTIETFFVRFVGFRVERACSVARRLENVLGREEVAKFCRILGYPDSCVHGNEVRHKWCRKLL